MSEGQMRWERLEEYLYDYDLSGKTFAARRYASERGLPMKEASRDIQAHLSAQRTKKSRTLFVLKREPGRRTRNAVWSVGQRTVDVRALGQGFGDDVKAKFRRAVAPDIIRISQINKRAAKEAERKIDAIADGALKVLEAAVMGQLDDE